MLIPLPVIEVIGEMDEGLFIDSVDLEWCFRATAKGFALYGICSAKMQHNLGDEVTPMWFIRRRNVIRHSPTRLYYMMRNRILLYQRRSTPLRWIAQDIIRLLFKFLLFFLFVKPRLKNARMMLCGIGDGILGREGKLDAM